MSDQFADFEMRLRQALAPVDPPAELEARLELTLNSLVDMAAEELEAWELSSMSDPRNWGRIARPVAAGVIGGTAAAFVPAALGAHEHEPDRRESNRGVDLLGRTVRDFAREAKRVADDLL